MKQFPEGFYWGETGVGPRRKAAAAWLRGERAPRAFARAQALGAEPGPRKIAAAIYAWWVAEIFSRKLSVTSDTIL